MTSIGRRFFRQQLANATSPSDPSVSRHDSELSPLLADIHSLKLSDDVVSLRDLLVFWLDSSIYSRLWDGLDLALNLVSVGCYILITLYCTGERGQMPTQGPPQSLETLDFAISCFLLFQWVPRLYLTLNSYKTTVSLFSLLTLLSTLPVIIVFTSLPADSGTLADGGSLVYLYPFRFWRLHFSFLMFLRPGRNALLRLSSIAQKAIHIGLSIFNMLFVVTAWVHLCLYRVQHYYDLTFFDVFYTITVSCTSGLATEIVPDNVFSRIITLYVMIVGAIFIPTNLADLLALIRSQSKYNGSFVSTSKESHIIVVGHFGVSHLVDFLREFYSDDHGALAVRTRVILLNPNEPSEELEVVLQDPLYSTRVKYVKGSSMSFRSLNKIDTHNADGIFILGSRLTSGDAVQEDAKMVMRALSIHRYNPNLKIFTHALIPGNKIHLEELVDHIVCIDEYSLPQGRYKMGMLAQNCLAPGFSTLLYLLTTTISDASVRELAKHHSNTNWVREYLQGATNEIYAVKLSSAYNGVSFKSAGLAIYQQFYATLFAVGFDEVSEGDSDSDDEEGSLPHRILLNPQTLVLDGTETVYLITRDSSLANVIAKGEFLNGVPTTDLERGPVKPISLRVSETKFTMGSMEDSRSSSSGRRGMHKDDVIQIQGKKGSFQSDPLEEDAPASPTKAHRVPLSANYLDNMKMPSDASDFILICALGSEFPSNLSYFVAPFRHKEPSKVIVILSLQVPTLEEWDRLDRFENVYVETGTPLLRRDLRRVRVEYASRVVVLADPGQEDIEDRSSDASALLAVMNIQAMTPPSPPQDNGHHFAQIPSRKTFITVEFFHPQNMKFVGSVADVSVSDRSALDATELLNQNLIPSFVGGHVFSESMFHSILCQTYYNPHLPSILRLFLFNGLGGHGLKSPIIGPTFVKEPKGSSMESMLHSHPSESFGNFYQIKVPSDHRFSRTTYGSLVKVLIEKYDAIVLGLYRKTVQFQGDDGVVVKFVIVNPEPWVLLQDEDALFVMAQKPIVWL